MGDKMVIASGNCCGAAVAVTTSSSPGRGGAERSATAVL